MTRIAAVAILITACAQAIPAQQLPPDSAIAAIVRERVDSGRARGLVVGVLENGRRRFFHHGTAGPDRDPLNEHTIFEIGSITKTVTGLLLADAVVRGEVRLDQPVRELLPDGTRVPARGDTVITLEHLATHRSGLPRLPSNLAPYSVADPYVNYDAERLYAFLSTHELARAPGAAPEYSNLGAGLLGHALALRAGASSYEALVKQRIADTLGMTDTWMTVPAAERSRSSAGHNASLDTVPAWNFEALAGAGALRSTAADMLTYLEAHLDTVSGPLARQVSLARTPRAQFALGRIALHWIVFGPTGREWWWHNGGTGGFRTFAAFDPARRISVVVLSNSSISADDIGMHLMNPAMPVRMPVIASPPATIRQQPEPQE